MKQTRILMGMPITVEIVDNHIDPGIFEIVFGYFSYIDAVFSTYKESSEISEINRGTIAKADWSDDMQAVFALAKTAHERTDGYFDIRRHDGTFDPSGIVKGWAIQNAATIIREAGSRNFFVDAGGDIQASGTNAEKNPWRVGIKNPFDQEGIVKALDLENAAIATSGTYIRGLHIYDPKTGSPVDSLISLTVVGKDIYDADLLATAAFAMGGDGIHFIERTPGFEAYSIDTNGIATMTTGFEKFVAKNPARTS